MAVGQEIIVGIDLGTTFSLVAYADERGAHIIRDEQGEGRVPSVIGFLPARPGETPRLTIGWEARRHAVENPRATVYSVKRLLGKGRSDIERELPFLAYAVAPGERDTLSIEIDGRMHTPEEISAAILSNLRMRAERHLGRPVTKAVITVPAYFDDAQRQATRDAGRIAGLEVVRIVNEPTAAALAYGLGIRGAMPDVDAAESRNSGKSIHFAPDAATTAGQIPLPMPRCHEPVDDGADEARNSKPKTHNQEQLVAVYDLGGGTFDVSILRVERDVIQVVATAGDTHLGGDDFDREITTLVQREVNTQFGFSIDSPATKQALRLLSESVKIRLSEHDHAAIELDLGGGRVYRREIRRAEFDSMIEPHIRRTLASCAQALRDARLSAAEIEQVVLVGGSTRIPLVRRLIQEHFGRVPYTALNPDEVVALGAAVQASILTGARRDMLLLDVTPLSLGIETMGGAMGKLIMRNTSIPCRATEQFTTFVDGQTAIKVNVLQGERELAHDCRSLGQFELRGIPPMPAGLPKVEVAFLIDANGILNVSARELRSGVQAGIQIIPSHGLTREEVDRMARESIIHAQADIDAHRRIDLVNQVTFDTHKAEQMLALHGGLLDRDERERIECGIAALRRMAETADDLDELHRALDRFGKSTLHLAEVGIREALVKK